MQSFQRWRFVLFWLTFSWSLFVTGLLSRIYSQVFPIIAFSVTLAYLPYCRACLGNCSWSLLPVAWISWQGTGFYGVLMVIYDHIILWCLSPWQKCCYIPPKASSHTGGMAGWSGFASFMVSHYYYFLLHCFAPGLRESGRVSSYVCAVVWLASHTATRLVLSFDRLYPSRIV